MKKVIVTGGAGFIGSQLVRELERREYQVVVLDCLTYAGSPKNLEGTHADLQQVDIRDVDAVSRLVRSVAPHSIYHLAADSHVQRSFGDQRRFLEVNAIGTENVIAAALNHIVRHFLHVSTDEVFGDVLEGRVDENGSIQPRNPYSASKAAAEAVVSAYRNWRGYPITMVRLSNCYGPRQHVEKLIPRTISRLALGQEATIHGDGLQKRDWLYVVDATRGIVDAVEKGRPGQTYNLPGPSECTVLGVVELLRAHIGGTARHTDDRPGAADRRYGMSGDKALRELKWFPETRFPDGLQATVEWYIARKIFQEAA